MLPAEDQARFAVSASAWIAHSEIIEAVVNGFVSRTAQQLNDPSDKMFWMLTEFAKKHPMLKGIAFRGWIFTLPEAANPIPRAIREDTIIRLPDIPSC